MCLCVTVICCYSEVGYRVTVMCVCYCNVLLQFIGYRVTVMCVCVTVMCCYSTFGYRVTVMCVRVTVMCCYITFEYRVTVMCVCYCNVLLEYNWVQGYCYVCVLLYCVAIVQLGTGLQLCACYCNVFLQYNWVQGYCYVCVTVMCCYSTVGYRVTVLCVCVLL